MVDDLTGKPVKGARISAWGTGAIRIEPFLTGADGRFSFRRIPSFARLHLGVSHRDHAPALVLRPVDGHSAPPPESTDKLEVRLGKYVDFSGWIVDAETGGATVVPVEWTATGERPLADGYVQRTAPAEGGSSSKIPADGAIRARLPTGPAVFHVETSYAAGAYRKPYDHVFKVGIPRDGTDGMVLSLPRTPGVLVRMESDDPEKALRSGPARNLIVEVREENSGSYGFADEVPVWFYPVAAWGKAMETRMVRRTTRADGSMDEAEIQPWTRIVADPKTWPVALRVP